MRELKAKENLEKAVEGTNEKATEKASVDCIFIN
jgi:hypothetical protein